MCIRDRPEVNGVSDREHVAALERAGRFDAVHGEAKAVDRRRDRRELAAA